MVALANPFTAEERDIWAPPEDIGTCDWADRYRILSEEEGAAQTGPYRSDRVPYARGVMDALDDPSIREVFVQKPGQSGLSEVGRNWIGRSCDVDPGPMLVVFPSKESCEETMTEKVIPMFGATPRLGRLLTDRQYDKTKRQLKLRSCRIFCGWSGSPQALATRAIAKSVCDELDKWAAWRGKEGGPLGLVRIRLRTFRHRSKLYGLSTPTTPNGPICRAVKACGDIRDFWVRCIHCDELQLPKWERVSWPGKDTDQDEEQFRLRKRLLESGECTAVYTCEHCDRELDQSKWWVGVERGEWVSVGHDPGEHPKSGTVGFRFSGLCSPWVGIQVAARDFVHAQLEGIDELQNFYNSTLGVPFWGEGTHGDTDLVVTQEAVWSAAGRGGGRGLVPEWAQGVVAGIDSSKVKHQAVVRAYGLGYGSQLVEALELPDGRAVLELLDRGWHGPGGRLWRISRACLDVGGGRSERDKSRTEELLKLCELDKRLTPVKGYGGSGRLGNPIRPGKRMTIIDTLWWKDVLASEILGGDWLCFPGVSADYVQQVASEKRVLVHTKVRPDKTTEEVWRWEPHAAGRANHFWDAEAYCTVASRLEKVGDQVVQVEYDYGAPGEEAGAGDYDDGWAPPERFWKGGEW